MAAETRLSLNRMLAIVAAFSVVGPISGALLFAALFGTVGILTMGPSAIFGGLFYFFWWLPSLYTVYGPPFLLTGVMYALAVRLFAPLSLLCALIAAVAAFSAYLSGRYWISGTIALTDPRLGPDVWSGPGAIVGLMLIGVVPSWWLVRKLAGPTRWF